jgi:3-hydroxypropanoate dehydrogenase
MEEGCPSMQSDEPLLRKLFLDARTHYAWRPDKIGDDLLEQVFALARMPPTSGNSNPMRVVFVRTPEGKRRLEPALKPGNVEKTMTAPVTAILGFDLRFHDHLERLAPHAVDRRANYIADPDLVYRAAFRNGTLQGAYFILAARALGLDCGPMSGFDHDIVDREFFADGTVKSNFLINLGYGDPDRLRPRGARFEFAEVCTLA